MTVLFSAESSVMRLNWLIKVLSCMISAAKSEVVPFIK